MISLFFNPPGYERLDRHHFLGFRNADYYLITQVNNFHI